MNNATQNKSAENKSTQWPVRNEAAAADLQRTREMPLLFQLIDVHRAAPASIPPAPLAAPAMPAPIELPTKSSFPLATSVPEPWPRPTTGLFEMPTGLSTAALAIGVTASKESLKTPTDTPTIAAAVTTAAIEKSVEKIAEPVAAEKTAPLASSVLPAAIDTAVKAATELATVASKAEPTASNVEAKSEAKTEPTAKSAAKPEAKSTAKIEAKVETKTDAKVDLKSPAKTESTARPKSPAPVAETTAAATKSPTAESKATPPTTAAEKPSPASLRRQRAEARQAKVDGKGTDWLQSHGKVIAICFVIALIGTIYLARRNRGTVAPSPSSEGPSLAVEMPGDHDHKTPDHKPTEAANAAPRLVEAPSHPLDTTPSPATTAVPSDPNPTSTAELQPPIVPNAGQSTTPPSGEPLFPWQQNNDPRVATRPDAPSTTSGATPGPANPQAPALNAPTYPETNLRDAPLLPPAPAGAPAAQPAPNSPAPSGPGTPGDNPGPSFNPPSFSAPGGSGGVPSRSYPASFTSAPGGNRYERTGSGLY